MHIIFNFGHEVSGTKVSCWNASYLLVEYFGKQDLKEVMFKILLLSVFSRPSTDRSPNSWTEVVSVSMFFILGAREHFSQGALPIKKG